MQRNFKVMLIAVLMLFSTASSASVGNVIAIDTLWRTRNDVITDNFYTTRAAIRDESIRCCGFYNLGAVAYVPRSANVSLGIFGFARYWAGSPQLGHFYTHLPDEQNWVSANGWAFEGFEGAVFGSPAAGLAALHRLNQWNPWSGDLQHYYTTNPNEIGSLQASGWGYDGIKGYVFALRPVVSFPSLYLLSRSSGQVYLAAPSIKDLSGSFINPADNACGGSLQVTLNGQYLGEFSNWTYGLVPGTFNTYTCYLASPFTVSRTVSNNFQLVHTGFAAFVSPIAAPNLSSWSLIPPSARVLTLGAATAVAIKAAPDAATLAGRDGESADIAHDERIADPRAVQALMMDQSQAPLPTRTEK